MEAIQYAVYKGKHGAAQFSMLPACYYCKVCREKNLHTWEHVQHHECSARMEQKAGAILVEATNGTSITEYHWDNKISFALAAMDLIQVIGAIDRNEKIRLFHDPNMKQPKAGDITKAVEFMPGKDGGYLLNISQTIKGKAQDDKATKHCVPMSADEVRMLYTLFRAAIPRLLAWT
jgi:hypothetical protein